MVDDTLLIYAQWVVIWFYLLLLFLLCVLLFRCFVRHRIRCIYLICLYTRVPQRVWKGSDRIVRATWEYTTQTEFLSPASVKWTDSECQRTTQEWIEYEMYDCRSSFDFRRFVMEYQRAIFNADHYKYLFSFFFRMWLRFPFINEIQLNDSKREACNF